MGKAEAHQGGPSIALHYPQTSPAASSGSPASIVHRDSRHLGGYCDLFSLPGKCLAVALGHTYINAINVVYLS